MCEKLVADLLAEYGCVKSTFLQDQLAWQGYTKEDVDEAVYSLKSKGLLLQPTPEILKIP